jgi:hypothetical protein
MPDFKCVACRIRLRGPGGEGPGALCPECRAPLERVGRLSEVVGYRAIEPEASPREGEPLTRPVSDLTTRREERIEELRRDAERWLDDGGSFDPDEAMAAALELPPRSEQ